MKNRKTRARYERYDGARRYSVSHPTYKSLTVTAPDENSAIVAAAERWGAQWTKYDFYSLCEVKPIGQDTRVEPGLHGGHEGIPGFVF